MKKAAKNIFSSLLAPTIILFFVCGMEATVECRYFFKTKNVSACFHIPYGAGLSEEEAAKTRWDPNIDVNIKQSLKYLFAMEAYANKSKKKVEIDYCFVKALNETELNAVLIKKANMKFPSSFKPIKYFEGYTLWLAKARDWKSYTEVRGKLGAKLWPIMNEIQNNGEEWEQRLNKNEWLGVTYVEDALYSVEGAEIEEDAFEGIYSGCSCFKFPRIWTYGDVLDDFDVRFGLFSTENDAWEAVSKLQLDKSQLQVLPIKMRLDIFYAVVMGNLFFL